MSAQQPQGVVGEVLAEAGLAHDDALARALEGIRALRPATAPAPTGELAALLADASTTVPAIPHARPAAVVQPMRPRTVKRHRGAMISAVVVAAMGLGATGVAALGGDPFGWIVPDAPAVVAEPPAAQAEGTPSPAVEPLGGAADGAADDAVAPPWLPGVSATGGAKRAQPTKASSGKAEQQGILGGAAALGRGHAEDAAADPRAAAPDTVSGAPDGGRAPEPTTPDTFAGAADAAPEDGSGAGDPGETDADAASGQGGAAAEDSITELRELARVSRGEVPGARAEGKGSGR
ncbi:hypothetical protein [Sinomonas mesophila]|uniref:hypothetical protein n=1 Tax=Sinomonas mesophila TaxID=1531955 RepID=UPI00098546C0|nr:hypothetical protein [Sinomonas mesophila]